MRSFSVCSNQKVVREDIWVVGLVEDMVGGCEATAFGVKKNEVVGEKG